MGEIEKVVIFVFGIGWPLSGAILWIFKKLPHGRSSYLAKMATAVLNLLASFSFLRRDGASSVIWKI